MSNLIPKSLYNVDDALHYKVILKNYLCGRISQKKPLDTMVSRSNIPV